MADATPTKKKPRAGWYPQDARPGELRRWDGAKWLDEWKPGAAEKARWAGGDYLLVALIAAVLGGIATGGAFFADETLGIVVGAIAGAVVNILLMIGIVAKGVEAGVRAARVGA